MIGVGVIGYGYWGPKLARNFSTAPGGRVTGICDARASRRELAAAAYPGVFITADLDALLQRADVDAVTIATPVSRHFYVAMAALRAGKHVLVEKPLAGSTEQAQRLVDEARRRGLVLLVDLTYVYAGAVRAMRELVASGTLGAARAYDATRANVGHRQPDTDVIWDLAVHDISIMNFVLGDRPPAVAACPCRRGAGGEASAARLTIYYEGALRGSVLVDWFAAAKARRTQLVCARKTLSYDDLEPVDKLKVVEHAQPALVDLAPRLDESEPLQRVAAHFLACVEGRETPLTDGAAGLRVIEILEAASTSMQGDGRPVPLDS